MGVSVCVRMCALVNVHARVHVWGVQGTSLFPECLESSTW